ncbi:MAG: N-6 DNA methylase [Candidatus Marinimicrobia bacterium]|nr:N-6 DNA methylase [Candidatus Neomarinimicrobiota bacterium]MCF7827595.1 N-6 DNA methylase [Candidatus Neomarinimicrobiota bacterium]MCF7881544.1 N-6 DNA methylase [Candidatus Neomarinimicrobiota bacterium]
MTITHYIDELNKRYRTGISREHSYRGDLQALLESMLEDVLVTNEPARVACGAPDYILTKDGIPIGFIEAKDIGDPDLAGKKANKEQFNRYKSTHDPFIFTDYLDFRFYANGEFMTSVRIAEIIDGKIEPIPEKFDKFKDLIIDFATFGGQTIRSAAKLSKMMAGKARLLSTIIENALNMDESEEADRVNEPANTTLREQLAAFRNVLMHDIDAKKFADIYAQTIAYGMFAARLHDPTLDSFSRQEAAELIPKTNPFLRKLFQYIAGYDLDDRIAWVVDALADIFRATDVSELLQDFGKSTGQHDPIIHFYETFLAEFDPDLRKKRGVWYTPEPVVNFIVRAVDDILQDEFCLKDGLADTSKTTVKVNTDVPDKRSATGYKQTEQNVHKVQILDPAAGTGTFLAEVIKHIYGKFQGQEGIWRGYVEDHLIPRLNGFEILMASYAMAHLKLDMLLRETGVERASDKRFRVYLTNSLEEHHPDTGTLFAGWLSHEANEANHVKRDTPVMVVMGNPPYSGISSNMGDWITGLIEDYKYVDGEHFGERKHWLHDDYVKFIRYGQHFVKKNGEGILAYINNHSFLDNPTFRGMRWNLLNTFDQIFILDLQGSTKKSELIPEEIKEDQNVFDIQQGVSINIFIKNRSKNSDDLGKVYYDSLWGSRNQKYSTLQETNFSSIDWEKINCSPPNYFFVPKDYAKRELYNKGFKVDNLFELNTMGFASARDHVTVSTNKNIIWKRVNDFKELKEVSLRDKYNLGKDSRDWTVKTAKDDIVENFDKRLIKRVSYRPFDERFTYYTGNSRGFYASPQRKVMYHLLRGDNIAFCSCKMNRDYSQTYWLAKNIVSKSVISTLDNNYVFPLYLYPDSDQQTIDGNAERKPNLDPEIVKEIAGKLGLKFTAEKEDTDGNFAPIDLLDYIYAVLHSPSYRDKYKEFLKIDFPRVPYPDDPEKFWQLGDLGGELRRIHLLVHPVVDEFITTYPVDGDNTVTHRLTKTNPGFVKENKDDKVGKVWINDKQYFGNVPEKAWEFYIGGYQPAQKWLKDRRDRTLDFEDIAHYQKIIVALMETDRLMGEIDQIEFE